MADQDSVKRINGFGDTANVDIVESYKDLGDGHHALTLVTTPANAIQVDAGGRQRVSQLRTLGDYKVLEYDHTTLLENAGTGAGSFSGNMYNMSVTANQWYVRTSRRFHHYFSGKSQVIEATFDNFQPQSGITKRVGYFSSSTVSPYSATLDGFWLESDGSTIRLISSRAGTETLNIALEDWDRYDLLSEYQDVENWQNFTVVLFDFLWLGGAVLRLWVQTSAGFVLAHTFIHAGANQNIFILSPNQPVRYEIRSSGGVGSFRYVCAQVSTEGSTDEGGSSFGFDTGTTAITATTVGTKYPILAVRKAYKTNVAVVRYVSILVASNNDRLRWTLEINPTLSAGLTYSAVPGSGLEKANGDGTITVTAPGTIIASGYHTQGATFPVDVLLETFLAVLGCSLNGSQDQMVLCLTPVTVSINSLASMLVKEY